MRDDRHPELSGAHVEPRVGKAGDDRREPQRVREHEDEGREHDGFERHTLRHDRLELRALDPAHQERAPKQFLHHRHDQRRADPAHRDQRPDQMALRVERKEARRRAADRHPRRIQPNPERENHQADARSERGLEKRWPGLRDQLTVLTPEVREQPTDHPHRDAVDPARVDAPRAIRRHLTARDQQDHERRERHDARDGGAAQLQGHSCRLPELRKALRMPEAATLSREDPPA